LRNSQDVTDLLKKHEERKTGLILMLVTVILVIITDSFVTDPNLKFLPTMWFCLLPLALAVMKKKNRKKILQASKEIFNFTFERTDFI